LQFITAIQRKRCEGVMVSDPPLIAFAYHPKMDKDNEEKKLVPFQHKLWTSFVMSLVINKLLCLG
jgi:hypothetical protein